MTAAKVWSLLATFAGYGFNKSHSCAYAHLAYYTAWYKTHHRAAFFAAVAGLEGAKGREELARCLHEARAAGLKVLPPGINTARADSRKRGVMLRSMIKIASDHIDLESDDYAELKRLARQAGASTVQEFLKLMLDQKLPSGQDRPHGEGEGQCVGISDDKDPNLTYKVSVRNYAQGWVMSSLRALRHDFGLRVTQQPQPIDRFLTIPLDSPRHSCYHVAWIQPSVVKSYKPTSL